MALYANVIIDISHEKLDRPFQYRIPEPLQPMIRPGVQVRIPFGKGGRETKGFVIGVVTNPSFADEKTKDLIAVENGSIPLESQMIALAAWIREQYGGTLNQALKTVMPVKKRIAEKEQRTVHLLIAEDEASAVLSEFEAKHQTARARVLKELLRQKAVPYDWMIRELKVSAAVLRKLEEKKLIRMEHQREYRNPFDSLDAGKAFHALNGRQREIAESIINMWRKDDSRPCLIHGVTGSGKTEIYMELIAYAVNCGTQAIVLIPEIALTFQTVSRFRSRFGNRVSILHSKMSAGERYDQFERASKGEIDVMIGPRSALFTPFTHLGCIIIDEEHEASYKSDNVPKYHARETAIARAKMQGAFVVLGSATPSIESYRRAENGEYQLYELKDRVDGCQLPEVYITDMREELRLGNRSVISERLRDLMVSCLEKKEQIMLFMNRRGVAGFVSCRSCGYVVKCPHCDVSLNLHNQGKMVCHYCGYEVPSVTVCPSCGSKYISTFRAGTQKVEAYIKEQFPDARILRMDYDTTRNKGSYENILRTFSEGRADILIGTQMIVKGHDFPNVTLVGILAADLSLHISDYRAAERTFQLLTQAAGRAGRGIKEGKVVIQTYQPEHYSILAAQKQDYKAFYKQEMLFRNLMHYPPAWNMLALQISSEDEQKAAEASKLIRERIGFHAKDMDQKSFQVIGPADAPVSKIKDVHKKVIFMKNADYQRLIMIKDCLEEDILGSALLSSVNIQFDFNPLNGF